MPERESQLEQKIAAWRARMATELGGRDEIAEELESHLRDGLEILIKTGVPPDEALARALARLGDTRAVAGEFERLHRPWWGGHDSRGARALAYLSGTLSLVGCVFYFRFSLLGFAQLLTGRALPVDPRAAGFWQTLALVMAVTSWLALRASHRLLERPSARDLRSVIAFSLLVLWMATIATADALPIAYATKLTALFTVLAGVGLVWRRSVVENRATVEVTL